MVALKRFIAEGNGMVAAMRLAGIRIPAEAWSLLESGEHTGRLGEAMTEVGQHLRDHQRRRRELAGQLWYPALVVATGLGVMLVILLWVVPELREVSLSMGQGGQLPWLTEHIGRVYGCLFAGLFGGGLLALAAGLLLIRLGQRYRNWSLLGERLFGTVPGLAPVRQARREARIFRQLGILLTGGVTLPRALEMTGLGCSSLWEKGQLDDFRRRLLMGTGFADCLEACGLISVDNRPLLLVGQESGRLDHYFQQLAVDLEERVSWRLRQGIRLLEPLFLLGLTIAIGGLILAYLLPMVRMLEQLA